MTEAVRPIRHAVRLRSCLRQDFDATCRATLVAPYQNAVFPIDKMEMAVVLRNRLASSHTIQLFYAHSIYGAFV